MDTHSKIGRVTYKKIIELPLERKGKEMVHGIREDFETIMGAVDRDGVAGMAMVMWDFRGYYMTALNLHPDSFVGRTFSPVYVAECLRKSLTNDEIRKAVEDSHFI